MSLRHINSDTPGYRLGTSDVPVKGPSQGPGCRREAPKVGGRLLDGAASPQAHGLGCQESEASPAPLPRGERESASGTPRPCAGARQTKSDLLSTDLPMLQVEHCQPAYSGLAGNSTITGGIGRKASPSTAVPDSGIHILKGKDNATPTSSALDSSASSVSPPCPEIANSRAKHYRLRRAAGMILPLERVHDCGQKPIGGFVGLHYNGSRANLSSVETCGSVWVCPVCAANITEGRREEVSSFFQAHKAARRKAFMATLTIPHHAFQDPKSLRKGVANAYRKVKQGKAWALAKKRSGLLHDVRSLEVTHGKNGWHPHIHALFFFGDQANDRSITDFSEWLYRAWARKIEKLGFGKCSRTAFDWAEASDGTGAADYISKWGASLELTKGHTKNSRHGRTPWKILQDFHEHRRDEDRQLFRAYAFAFKGARQLTWSKGARDLYPSIKEASDEELATEDSLEETQVASLDRKVFLRLVELGQTAELLLAYESGGNRAVLALLTRLKVPWRTSLAPGYLKDKMVLRISLGPPGDHPPTRRKQGFYALGGFPSHPFNHSRISTNDCAS